MDPSLLPRVPPPPPVRWTGRQPGATSGGYSTTPNYPSAAPVDGNYKQTPYHGGGGYSNRASGAAGGTCGGCDQQQSSSFCGREQYDNENYNTVGKGADQRDSWGFGSRSGTANYDNYHYNSGYGRADGTTGSATTTHFQGKNKNNDYSYNNGPSYNTNGNSNYYNSSYGRRDNSAHPAGQHRGTATMKGSSTTTTDNWTKGSSNPTTCTSAPPINLDTTHINGTKTLLVDGEPFARDDFDTAAWCTRSSFNKIMHNRSSNFDYHYNLGLKSSGILTTTPCNYDTIGGGGRDRENGKTGGKNQGGKFNKFNDTKGLTDNYKGGIPLNPLLGKPSWLGASAGKKGSRTDQHSFKGSKGKGQDGPKSSAFDERRLSCVTKRTSAITSILDADLKGRSTVQTLLGVEDEDINKDLKNDTSTSDKLNDALSTLSSRLLLEGSLDIPTDRIAKPPAGGRSNRKRGKANTELYKTCLCYYHLNGQCRWGSSCHHAHSLSELRQKPDLSRTAMCPHLLKWGYCGNVECNYAHHKGELQSTEAFVKTKMCNNPARCSYGQNCRYAHDIHELRYQVVLPRKSRQRNVPNFGQQLRTSTARMSDASCLKDDDDDLMCYPVADEKQGEYLTEARLKLLGFDKIYSKIFPASEKAEGDHDDAGLPDNQVLELDENETAEPVCAEDSEDRAVAIKGRKTLSPNILLPCLLIDDSDHDSKSTSVDVANKTTALADEEGKARDEHPPIVEVQLDVIRLQEDDIEEAIQEAIQEDDEKPRTAAPTTTPVYEDTKNHALVQQEDQQNKAAQILNALLMLEETEDADAESSMVLSEDVDDEKEEVDPRRSVVLEAPAEDEHAGEVQKTELEKEESSISSMELEVETSRINTNLLKEEEAKTTTMKKIEDPMLSASLVPAVEEVQLYSKEAAWNNTAIVEDEFMINSITVKKELHQVEQEPKHQDEKIPAAATIASDDVEVLPTDVVDGVESTLDHAPLPDLLFCTDSKLIKDTPMESLASTRLPTTVAQSTLTMAAQSTLTMAAQSTLTMVAQSTLTMRTEDDVVGEKKEEAEALKVHEEETKALAADTHAEAKGDEDEKEEDKCKVQETEDLVKTTQICDDAVAVDMEKKVDSSFCVTDHVVAAETASVVLPFSEESSDAALIAEKEADTSAAKKEVGEQADTTTKNASPLDQSTTDNMLPDSKDKGNEESEQKKPVTKGQRGYNKTNSTAGGPKSTSKIIPPPPPPPMGNKNLRRQLFENKKLRFENWQQKMGAAAALQRTAAEGDVGVSDSYPRSLGVLPGFDTALFGSTNSKFPPGRISNKNGKGPLAGAGTLSATLPPTTPTALVSGASPTGLGSWGQTPHNKAGFGTMGAFGAAGNGPLGGASTSGNSYQQNKRSKSSGKNSGSNAGGAAVSTSKNSTSSGTGASTTTLNSMGNNYSNKYKNDVNNSHSSLGGNGKASGGREGPFSGGLFSSSASGRYSGAKANGGKNTTSFNAGGASSNNNNYTSTGPGTSSSAAYNQGLSTGGRGSNSSNSYGGASSAYHNQQTGYGSRPSFPQVDSYQHGNHLGNMRKDTTSTSLLQPPPPVQPLPPLRSDNELSNSLLNVPPTAPSGDDPSGMSQQPMLMSSSASGTSANHKWMTPVGGLKGSTPALLGSSRHPATGYGGPSPSLGVPALLPLSSLSQPAPGASFSSIPPNGEPYSNSSAFPTASSAAQSSGLSSFSATVNNINMSSSTSTTILPPPLPAAQPQAVADLLFPTISMQSVESTANTLYPVANFGDKNTSSITTSACSGLGLSTSGFNNNNNVNFINIVSSSGSGGGILSSSTHLQQGTTSGTTLGNPMQPATSLFPTCNSSSASNNATSSLNHQLLASSGSSIGLMSPPPDALDSTSCSAIMNQNPSSCGIMATPSLFPTVSSSVVPQSACLNQLSSQQLLAPSINYNQNNSTSYNDYSSCGNFSGTTSAPGVLMARSMPQQSSFGSFLPLAGSEQQTIMGADNSTLLPPPPSPMSGGYPPLGVPNNANAAATSHGGRGFINSIMTSNAALQSPFFSGAGGPPIAPDLPPPITGPTTVLGGPSSSTFLFGGCTNASASVGMGLKPAGGMGTSLPTLGFNGHTVPVPPLPAFNFDSTCSGAFNFDSTCSGGYSTNSFSGGLAGGQGAAHCGSFFQDFASAGTGAPGASGTTGITFPAHASASSPDLVTCPDLTCSHQLGTNTTSVFGVTAPFPLPHPLEGSAKTPPLNMPTAQQTHQQGSEQQQSPGTYNNVAVVDGELPLLTCGDMCLQPFVQPTNSKANKPCPRHSTTGGLFVGARQSNTSLTGGAPGPRHSGTINPRRSTQLGGPARNSHSSHCSYGARGSVSSIARASVYTADHLLQSSPGRRSIRNGCPLTPPTPQGDRRNSV